jgi:glycosyltransferase involved in cell wall biosynthesis
LLIGYIDAQLGLGQSLRGLALALSQTAINFRIHPFGVGVEGRRSGSYMPERYDMAKAHAVNIIEVSPDELPNVLSHIRDYHFDRSYNILRTYWELGQAPKVWQQKISSIDEIWAPTKFVAQSFTTIFDRTITIIPPSLELPSVDVADHHRFNLDQNSFYFLFSFDYHSLPTRKNPLAVQQAFRLAFPDPSARVGLIIKSTGAVDHYPELRQALLRAAEEDSRIRVIDETISRQEMLALIKAADCYVSLHRAEGFGLGMVEAMAFGKPVIATDYSGSTDFLSEATGYPVPYRLTKVGTDEYVHAEGQVWAEPSESDCARIMSHVFHNREEAAARARRGQLLVNERYSPANVGRLAEKRLNEIFALQAEGAGAGKPKAR